MNRQNYMGAPHTRREREIVQTVLAIVRILHK
jgi:hypothetical protein